MVTEINKTFSKEEIKMAKKKTHEKTLTIGVGRGREREG
jgi:hypothetical protein